jgi:hypothetical protein
MTTLALFTNTKVIGKALSNYNYKSHPPDFDYVLGSECSGWVDDCTGPCLLPAVALNAERRRLAERLVRLESKIDQLRGRMLASR